MGLGRFIKGLKVTIDVFRLIDLFKGSKRSSKARSSSDYRPPKKPSGEDGKIPLLRPEEDE
jgi:hypothetical protein